jgi:hypothetical protein
MSKERKNTKSQSAICEGMGKIQKNTKCIFGSNGKIKNTKIQSVFLFMLYFCFFTKKIQDKYKLNFSKIQNTKKYEPKISKIQNSKKKNEPKISKCKIPKKKTNSKMSQRANPMFILKSKNQIAK